GFALAWGNLGLALQTRGEWEQAIEAFDRSFQLRPAPGLLVKCALALPVILDSDRQLREARQRFDAQLEALLKSDLELADPMREAGVGAFHLAYHGIDDRERYARVARMFLRATPALNFVAPHCQRPRAPAERLSIGFISRYFYNHSVGRHYGGLVRLLA